MRYILLFLFASCAQRITSPLKSVQGLKSYSIQTEYFSSEFLGAGNPNLKVQSNLVTFNIPLVAEEPGKTAECFYSPLRLDTGRGLMNLLDDLKSSAIQKGFHAPVVAGLDALVINGHGTFLTNQIIFKRNDSSKFTNLTLIQTTFPQSSMACLVNFPRSRNFLVALMEHFIINLKIPSEYLKEIKPHQRDVSVLKTAKQSFGWTETLIFNQKNKQKRYVTFTSTLSPGGPTNFIHHDWMTTELIDPLGKVYGGQYISERNRENIFNLILSKSKGDSFDVKGSYYQKPVDLELEVKEGLDHHYLFQEKLRDDRNITFPYKWTQYIPHLDITKALSGKIEKMVDKKNPSYSTQFMTIKSIFLPGKVEEHRSYLRGQEIKQILEHIEL